jgi:signal peptidase I
MIMPDVEKQQKGSLKGLAGQLLFALLVAVLIRAFIIQLYWIPSESMEPQLLVGDGIVANKIVCRLAEPVRGDIFVFRFPKDQRVHIVKRVIGLPGEKVEIKDDSVYIDGEPLQEPYLEPAPAMPDYGPVEVPPGQYFMMGDNREGSQDSRAWGFVPRSLLVGKAWVRFWPLSRISVIR